MCSYFEAGKLILAFYRSFIKGFSGSSLFFKSSLFFLRQIGFRSISFASKIQFRMLEALNRTHCPW